MNHRILNPNEFRDLTPEEVRDWAYNEDLHLSGHHDAPVLHNIHLIPILIELAADPKCPKQQLLATALSVYSQSVLLARNQTDSGRLAEEARTTIYADAPLISKWREWYRWLYERLADPLPVMPEEAERMAWLLTVGDHQTCDFTRTGRSHQGYTEFLASTSTSRLYVYINEKTGVWRKSSDLWDAQPELQDCQSENRDQISCPKRHYGHAHQVLGFQMVLLCIFEALRMAAAVQALPNQLYLTRSSLVVCSLISLTCPFLVVVWTSAFTPIKRLTFILVSILIGFGTLVMVIPIVR